MSGTNSKRVQLATISLAAALMGIGQNGLLVSLPFLVEQSAFGLSAWSILIATGSFLFLPSAPFWGRYSDKHGPKKVVIQALIGMAISFSFLALFAILSKGEDSYIPFYFTGLLVARIIYGCTVSGMVPASQHWAIILCGKENRLQAITSVSIGLSAGRLVGPLISILALKLSPFAPLMIMVTLPCIALMGAINLPIPNQPQQETNNKSPQPWLPKPTLYPYLMSGLFLCAAIALLQYSFSPLLSSITDWSTSQISDGIGALLTISAACTFGTQLLVIKKKKLTPRIMYQLGAFAMVMGFTLFLVTNIWVLCIAMAVVASGAALLVPAYTSAATEQQNEAPGAVAGYLSMAHTIGYGVASLLAFMATLSPTYPIYLCILFSATILIIAYSVSRYRNTEAVESP